MWNLWGVPSPQYRPRIVGWTIVFHLKLAILRVWGAWNGIFFPGPEKRRHMISIAGVGIVSIFSWRW